MSVEAIAWVLNHAPVESPVSKLVLVALANHAHPDGSAAFPSVATICRYTCLSERSVRQHLDSLEKHGIIKRCDQRIVAAYIDRTDRRPIGYDIVMGGVQEMQVVRQRGAGDAVNGVQEIPKRGAGGAPKPSNKPSNETHSELVTTFQTMLAELTPAGVSVPQPTPEWSKSLARLLVAAENQDRLEQVMRFALADTFWRRNIRTPMNLEKHWDRLLLEMPQTTPTTRQDQRVTDAMTQVHNFFRLKKPQADIVEYISGLPEHIQKPVQAFYETLEHSV